MPYFFLFVFALFAGMALPVQTAINAELRTTIQSPYLAAMISFLVGATVLCGVTLAVEHTIIPNKVVFTKPWWIWSGGALGILFVLANVILMPKIGSALTVGLTLAGQLIMAIIIDHFGWFHLPVHEINIPRIIGVLLILGGIFLVQRF
ncbi:DMT family transporter [Niallia sp. 01092]|uniref:DMT family transporter n=1 Tax=unclassified Niallia TaxID=2837522 RepID=UPI003FD3E3E5